MTITVTKRKLALAVVALSLIAPSTALANHIFGDVNDRAFYTDATQWAKDNDITTGSPAGSDMFKPDDPVTRGEAVTFMKRYDDNVVQPAIETNNQAWAQNFDLLIHNARRVTANIDDIATNTADIATNTADIATNKSAIAAIDTVPDLRTTTTQEVWIGSIAPGDRAYISVDCPPGQVPVAGGFRKSGEVDIVWSYPTVYPGAWAAWTVGADNTGTTDGSATAVVTCAS